jgi:hypothetical protein
MLEEKAMDAKAKAKRSFHFQALKEAVERMKPELAAASEAAHGYEDADTNADEGYSDFARTAELGFLVEAVGGLCGPHLALLCEIAYSLPDLHSPHEPHHHQEKTKPS